MNERDKRMELLGSAPVPKALLAMGLPAMIGMMINAVYNLVDAYFVGGLGTSQMGAVAIAFPIGQVIVGIGLLFGNGAGSYISRLLGNGERQAANRVASTALYSSIFVGAIFSICTIAFLNPILRLLGATGSILPYATSYARIFVISSILNVFNVTMNSIVTSEGAAKTSMLALLAGALLNAVLDPIFIYTLNLGIAGAAIATAISQLVSASVYLLYVLSKKSAFSFSIRECRLEKGTVREIARIGVPTLAFQVLTGLSIMLVNMQAAKHGDSLIAGMGAVTRIISLGSLMVFGFLKGFQPVAGYSYGARNYVRLREAIKTSAIWSTLFCMIFGLAATLFSVPLISQFTKGDRAMIDAGSAALRANGFSFMLFGFQAVYSSLFLALGKAREGLFLSACRQGICFIPIIALLPALLGQSGILYAQPIADVVSAALTAVIARGLHRELRETTTP